MKCIWPSVRRKYLPAWYKTDSDVLRILDKRTAAIENTMNSLNERITQIELMLTVVHKHIVAEKNRSQRAANNQPVHDE